MTRSYKIGIFINFIQLMLGLEGDLEEWQTQEVNVTRGEAEGDIDQHLFWVIFLGDQHLFCFVIPDSFTFSCKY